MATDVAVRLQYPASTTRPVSTGAGYLGAMLIALIVLQRFAISPGGFEIPIGIPVVLAILVIAYLRGAVDLHPTRTPLTIVVWATAILCTLAQIVTGTFPSLLSLTLLLLLYIPQLFASTGGAAVGSTLTRLFVGIMTVAAIISLVQFLGQYVGIPNVDYIGTYVPDQFQVHGFSPNATITYGSSLRRSNGLIFMEPSFLSLFLGLAVLIAVRRGTGWIQPTILLAGMVPTLAGNGLVVLLPGLAILLLSPGRKRLLALIPGVIGAIGAALFTGLGSLYLSRSTEAGASGSSSSFRFVQPYSTLMPASLDSPFAAIFGHGAGSSDAFLDTQNLFLITRPAIPKALYEYGVIGGVVILGLLIVMMIMGLRDRPWMVGLVVAFFFINASLLQSTLVFFTVFWLYLVPINASEGAPEPEDLVDPPVPLEDAPAL